MPTFTYTARDQKGQVQTGHLQAMDEDQVVGMLQHRGLLVTSVSQAELTAALDRRMRPSQFRARRMHAGVTVNDQVLLCQELATLIGAGVPLIRSLEVVSSQVQSRRLLTALEEVQRDVDGGSSLRDALAKHPAIFSRTWLSLIETGEASGQLAQSLQHLARHFESARRLKDQALTAAIYPVFLIAVAVIVLAIFVYWLIPRFTGMFTTMDLELPLLTRLVVKFSHAARRYLVATVIGLGAVGYLLRRYLRTEPGKWMRDRLLLRLPLAQTLCNCVQLAEFGRGLSTLLAGGVPLLMGLEIIEHSATNKVYGGAIGQIREAVKEGKTMAEPMERTGIFPPMTIEMVRVGEEIGDLVHMTDRVASYYEEQIELLITRMTRMFEPAAIVIMGGIVLVVVLAIFLPIFRMAGSGGIHH